MTVKFTDKCRPCTPVRGNEAKPGRAYRLREDGQGPDQALIGRIYFCANIGGRRFMYCPSEHMGGWRNADSRDIYVEVNAEIIITEKE